MKRGMKLFTLCSVCITYNITQTAAVFEQTMYLCSPRCKVLMAFFYQIEWSHWYTKALSKACRPFSFMGQVQRAGCYSDRYQTVNGIWRAVQICRRIHLATADSSKGLTILFGSWAKNLLMVNCSLLLLLLFILWTESVHSTCTVTWKYTNPTASHVLSCDSALFY